MQPKTAFTFVSCNQKPSQLPKAAVQHFLHHWSFIPAPTHLLSRVSTGIRTSTWWTAFPVSPHAAAAPRPWSFLVPSSVPSQTPLYFWDAENCVSHWRRGRSQGLRQQQQCYLMSPSPFPSWGSQTFCWLFLLLSHTEPMSVNCQWWLWGLLPNLWAPRPSSASLKCSLYSFSLDALPYIYLD